MYSPISKELGHGAQEVAEWRAFVNGTTRKSIMGAIVQTAGAERLQFRGCRVSHGNLDCTRFGFAARE